MNMKRTDLTRLALTLLAAGLTAAGLLLGQHGDVMKKAVTICLECIGID